MKPTIWKNYHKLVESPVVSKAQFQGRLLHVYLDDVRLPDGTTSTREWIKHPGACAVVPVFPDGSIMLVKQYRYPVRQIFFEVPAGKIDPDESADTTALRETEEETGLKANSMAYIGHFYPVIGYSDEIIHIYTAWDLDQTTHNSDDDEFLINVKIPFKEAIRMIELGEITDAKTICSLLKTKMWWRKHKPYDIAFS